MDGSPEIIDFVKLISPLRIEIKWKLWMRHFYSPISSGTKILISKYTLLVILIDIWEESFFDRAPTGRGRTKRADESFRLSQLALSVTMALPVR